MSTTCKSINNNNNNQQLLCKAATVLCALLDGSGGAVNSLDFCLASFKSHGCFYFWCILSSNERQWQLICEFYTANFKGIFGGPQSECVWQQAIICCLCYMMPQNKKIPLTRDLLVSQKMMQTLFFSPPSPFPCNFCNCNSGGICTASQF